MDVEGQETRLTLDEKTCHRRSQHFCTHFKFPISHYKVDLMSAPVIYRFVAGTIINSKESVSVTLIEHHLYHLLILPFYLLYFETI